MNAPIHKNLAKAAAAPVNLKPPLQALLADDAALRAHVGAGELPVLLLTVAHLTGDLSVLRPEWRPQFQLCVYAGNVSGDAEKEARALCLRKLIEFCDSGAKVPARPGYDQFQEMVNWVLGKDAEGLLPLLAEQVVFGDDDRQAPRWNKAQLAPETDFEVAVIGAGESGLLTAHRLKQAGVPFVIYEKNIEVGGTWWENTYPGCRVDINSFIYSYTFAQKAWREYFGARDDVLAYLKEVAAHFGLYEHIRFGTEVLAADWDESKSLWRLRLRTPQGERQVESNVVVSAVGQLNRPSWPDIAGRESFSGHSFHSARWDHDCDLRGKRVGVIGTGASALQFIPHVARQAAAISIFARTTPWLLPTPNLHAAVEDDLHWLLAKVPLYAEWHRLFTFIPQLVGFLDAATVDPEYPPTERAISAANEAVRAGLTQWVEAQTGDRPDLRPLLIADSPPGSKRLPRDNGTWIATLKRDNVSTVTTAISAITPCGIRTADGTEHEFDVLIYGTGFHASEFLMPMKVTGRGGADLHQLWGDDARAYLGSTIPGFPNLFCLYGPNTNLVLHGASIFFISECAVSYALEGIRLLLVSRKKALDVRHEVHDRYNDRLDEANQNRAWGFSKVSSWYKNKKGRVTQNWPFTALELWRRTHDIEPQDYRLE